MTQKRNDAIDFYDANFNEVQDVEKQVLEAGKRFLEGVGQTVLPPHVVVEAGTALRQKTVGEFLSAIRPHAAEFVSKRLSSPFWAMVDACNFYLDAATNRWRYMTEEGRHQNLKWAAEEAALV